MNNVLLKFLSSVIANKLMTISLAFTIASTAVVADPELRAEYMKLPVFQSVADYMKIAVENIVELLPDGLETLVKSALGGAFPAFASVKDASMMENLPPSEFEVLVCGRCHASTIEKRETMPFVHVPFAAGRCSDCHLPHDPQTFEAKLAIDRKELCNTCHNFLSLKEKPYQHVPFKNNRCMDCHNPHASENIKQLVLPPQVLCRTCHNFDKGNYYENKHPPYQVGDCIVCHHPHAADNPKNTRDPLPDLCFRCHRTIAKQQETASVLHPPFAASMCTTCHNPHQTNTYKLTKKSLPDLCFQCHNSKRIMGGFSSHPMFSVISPFDGKAVTCLSCHNPHGNENERMWRRPKQFLCLGCHKDKADKPIPPEMLMEKRYDE